MSHTPGPWTALIDPDGRFEIECDTHIIAGRGPLTHAAEESKANARLIAAAPEMLEALRQALLVIESLPREGSVCGVIGRAIDKAEGKAKRA
jgi:hypothetical protein